MRAIGRRLLPLLVIMALLAFGGAAAGQGGTVLTPGTSAAGTLDGESLIQVYTLPGSAGETYALTLSHDAEASLALVVTDATGAILAQSAGTTGAGETVLDEFEVPANGVYYVTVLNVGAPLEAAVEFSLVADLIGGEAQPTTAPSTGTPAVTESTDPGQLVTTSGLTVRLSWDTTDDLDLEVRDPVGGALYWETPVVNSGGALSPNVNQGCAVPTTPAAETATWSPGGIPTGSYEIIIYYQQSCEGDRPVTFTVDVTVDGAALPPITSTLRPSQVFVTAFVVRADGTSALTGASGLESDQVLPAPAAEILASAQPIEVGTSVTGRITNTDIYQAYSFTASANDLVTIAMEATSGSLDTYIALLDSAGNIIRFNDDQATGFTNSLINNTLLPSGGTYIIVATRYAKAIGGTEGDYVLTLSSQATDLPEEFVNLPRGSIEVRLLWNTSADLQLLVRDPAGDSVFDDVPTVRSGGRLAAQGNVNCRVSDGTAFSYIYWPLEVTPRPGSYEVEVWYQNECGDTTPVSFNLYITVNGREIFSDTAQPILNERYLTSFTINADGSAAPSDGGIIRGLATLDYQSELENAIPILPGAPVNGSITPTNKFDVYTFNALAGTVVTIAMNNTSGTLDPTLYLISPSGTQVAENDDAVAGENTNSLIADLTLPEDGQYIIIATHFGALYGGTTGTYQLSLTQLN